MLNGHQRRMDELRTSTKRQKKYKRTRVEEHNNWYEKYTRGTQKQFRKCKRMDQQYWRQGNGKHSNRIAQRKKNLKNGDRLRDLCDNIKNINIYIIEAPEGAKRNKGEENVFEEIVAKS